MQISIYPGRDLNDKENQNVTNIFSEKERITFQGTSKQQITRQQKNKLISKGNFVKNLLKKDNLPERLKHQYTSLIVKNYYEQIYSSYVQRVVQSKNFLASHQITPHLRAKMIDWIIQVLSSYKMSEQVFFKSVSIMDRYFKIKKSSIQTKQLHLIGVASMFMACKYQQVYPIKLETFADKICRGKFTVEQIKEKQGQILISLGFSLEFPTLLNLTNHIQSNLQFKIVSINQLFQKKINVYFNDVIIYLAKMTLFEYQLAEQDHTKIAFSIIFIALKTVQQVQTSIKPEQILLSICNQFQLKFDLILEKSRKVLELAKNFNLYYPQFKNLKKFNKFTFQKQNYSQ